MTIANWFPYPSGGNGSADGSRAVDAGSVSASAARAATVDMRSRRQMSNALLVAASRSANGRPLAVMGPQVGYFYPQFLMELDLHGGGIDARGAAFPGVSLYVLLGRGRDYAWSATSSGSDNIDQYVERLCNRDGSPATRASTGYLHKDRCREMGAFDAGTLSAGGGEPARQVSFRDDGPRPGQRHGDDRRAALRGGAEAVDTRPRADERDRLRRPQRQPRPLRARLRPGDEPGRVHVQLALRRRPRHRVLLVWAAAGPGTRDRPEPADARHRPLGVARVPLARGCTRRRSTRAAA